MLYFFIAVGNRENKKQNIENKIQYRTRKLLYFLQSTSPGIHHNFLALFRLFKYRYQYLLNRDQMVLNLIGCQHLGFPLVAGKYNNLAPVSLGKPL